MKIYRSVSEKRTYRTMSDEFVSREFVAGREIDVPDDLTPAARQILELELMLDLRREVLTGFVLEGQLKAEDFAASMAAYEGILAAAKQPPSLAPAPAAV